MSLSILEHQATPLFPGCEHGLHEGDLFRRHGGQAQAVRPDLPGRRASRVSSAGGLLVRARLPQAVRQEGHAERVDRHAVTDSAKDGYRVTSAPHHEAVVIDRSQPGDHCQMTLERWLPISDEPRVEAAVTAISAILAAAACADPPRTIDTTTAP